MNDYETILNQTVAQYPGLLRVLGAEESGREMARVLYDQYGDVLSPYEILTIGYTAIERASQDGA